MSNKSKYPQPRLAPHQELGNRAGPQQLDNPLPIKSVPPWDEAGISATDWRSAIAEFHTEFVDTVYKRTFYVDVYNDILGQKQAILGSTDPVMTRFREWLQRLVVQAGKIETALCIGIGPIEGKHLYQTDAFINQTAVFLAFCDLIDQKAKETDPTIPGVPRLFQDPIIDKDDKYVLHALGGEVIVHPAATNIIRDSPFTFVMAPFLTKPAVVDIILQDGPLPAVYINWRLVQTISGITEEFADQCLLHSYINGKRQIEAPAHLTTAAMQVHRLETEYYIRSFSDIFDKINAPLRRSIPHNDFGNLFAYIRRPDEVDKVVAKYGKPTAS